MSATSNASQERPVCAASPCINVCKMEALSGLCIGCQRTIDEIAAWSQASNAERRCILAAVESRRAEKQRPA
jgi:uncharacterized protein